jgi:hypothetical protein
MEQEERFICVHLWKRALTIFSALIEFISPESSLSVNESDLGLPEAYGFDSFTPF